MLLISRWRAGNEIGDEGARDLAEALKENTTLRSLKLKCEGLFFQNGANLFFSIAAKLSEAGIRLFGEALKVNLHSSLATISETIGLWFKMSYKVTH